MTINEKSPKSQGPENLELDDFTEGATVIRKVDVNQLAREAADARKRTLVATQVSFISLHQGTYLIVPAGPGFKGEDGDSVNEDGITGERAKQKILTFFGQDVYLTPSTWEHILHAANAGTKVILELGDQVLASPDTKVVGKFPIRMKG